MAAAFQRISDGRLLLNVVTGGEPVEQARFGDHLSKAERYARTDEFLSVVRGAWTQGPFDFDGEHYQIEGAAGPRHASTRCRTSTSVARPPRPARWRRGTPTSTSPGASRRAGRGEARLDPRPGEGAGREIRFGLRIHTLSRDTSERGVAGGAVAARRPRPGHDREGPAGTGRQRVHGPAAHARAARRPEHVRVGARPRDRTEPVVGRRPGPWRRRYGARRVATRRSPTGSRSTTAIGIDEFILSGYPHVEEAYWFAEGVKPILRAKGIFGRRRAPGRRLASA